MLIDLPHKKCDFTCMWNGFEDMYEWKTGSRAPDYLFFGVSGFCNFIYLKQKNAACKRMIYWSNGLTRKMYDFIQDIIGFSYKINEGNNFGYAFNQAKQCLDKGSPVILGVLDMFHLPYYDKYYQKFHIPIHHVLMVGYDDNTNKIYVHDCGKETSQTLSYENLENAWNVNLPGFSRRNTFFEIVFKDRITDSQTIFKDGLLKKCNFNLNPPVSIFGIPAIRKFAKEVLNWEKELGKEEFKKSLCHLIEYTGFPPSLPPDLIEDVKLRDEIPNNHRGSRDIFAKLLIDAADLFNLTGLDYSARLFTKSGILIDNLSTIIMEYLLGKRKKLSEVKNIIYQIADIEEKAYIQLKAELAKIR